MGTENFRGSVISASKSVTAIASARRSKAFFVIIKRNLDRRGFKRASRTACIPKIQKVSAAIIRLLRSFSTTQVGFCIRKFLLTTIQSYALAHAYSASYFLYKILFLKRSFTMREAPTQK